MIACLENSCMIKHFENLRLKDFLLNSPSARLIFFSDARPLNYIIELAFGSSNGKYFSGARPLSYISRRYMSSSFNRVLKSTFNYLPVNCKCNHQMVTSGARSEERSSFLNNGQT